MALRGSLLAPEHVLHLESERLVMRRLTADDDELLVDLDADPEVVRYLRPHRGTTLELVRETVLPKILGYYEKWIERGAWATHERATGVFIGWFMSRPDHDPPHELELGYRLRRAAWGKGYATEMSRVILTHAFEVLGAPRVIAYAETENEASWRVMEKIGMRREREHEIEGISRVDYGIERDAWFGRRGA